MSPLTLKKIKDAKGKVRIQKSDINSKTPTVVEWYVQVLTNDSWETVFTDRNRTVCEQVISKANRQVILG